MISSRTLILIFTLFFTATAQSQSTKDYTEYHQTMLMVEQWIADEDFNQAIVGYRALIKDYGRLLARDAFNACQVAALLKHPFTDSLYYYSALAGVPEPLIKHNALIGKLRAQYPEHFDGLYTSGNDKYLARIDVNLRKEWIDRFQQEQKMKSDPSYKDIVTANFNRIKELAAQGKFPGEQTIGVDNNLENGYVIATLLHFPYSYKLLERDIETAIRHGEFQPLGALYVYGFNQTRTSVLYDQAVPHEDAYFSLTYNLPFGKYDANTETVDANRARKNVSSLKVHRDIDRVAKHYRIDYKLGY